jgi:hypothetical protein
MKATPWKELKDRKISKERQAEIAKAVQQDLLEMTLADLRREAGLTQVEL